MVHHFICKPIQCDISYFDSSHTYTMIFSSFTVPLSTQSFLRRYNRNWMSDFFNDSMIKNITKYVHTPPLELLSLTDTCCVHCLVVHISKHLLRSLGVIEQFYLQELSLHLLVAREMLVLLVGL